MVWPPQSPDPNSLGLPGQTKASQYKYAEEVLVTEGEGYYLNCALPDQAEHNTTEYIWYKHETQEIVSSEEQLIHQHNGELFFLPILLNDSAVYSCHRQNPGKVEKLGFNVTVNSGPIFYSTISEQGKNPSIRCPDVVVELCQNLRGNLSWYKDFKHIPNMSKKTIHIQNASEWDGGIYTCMCSWEHKGKTYNTSASRKFKLEEPFAHYSPIIRSPMNNTTEISELGSSKQLVCSVFCGYNVEEICKVGWEVDGVKLHQRYIQEVTREVKDGTSISNVILTIHNVLPEDFHTEFQCVAENTWNWVSVSVYLQPRVAMHTHTVIFLCIMVTVLIILVAFKCFTIDLLLLFRGVLTACVWREDGKLYDACVIYQTHNIDKAVEEKIGNFVTRILPSILEKKWGYKLFIYGRDDLPGEDCIEMIETHIKLSRRLMVVLTQSLSGDHGSPASHQCISQMVLHQAVVLEELKVILIQLEKMDGYSHLPKVLQFLVHKSTPLTWEEGDRGDHSRFWKHVRYMMPPASPYHTDMKLLSSSIV